MDNPDSRPAHSSEPASDDSASPFNSPTRDAGDRLAFDPVPLRYRTGGLTPARQREYVEALADCGVVREAAARVGVSEQAINRVRRRSDARSFDNACEAAQMFGARRLRSVAFERAVEGTVKGRYYRGERVGEERVYDNRLLIYLLGKAEHLFQAPREARDACDDWDAHMDALESGAPPPPPSKAAADEAALEDSFSAELVWQEEDGTLRTCFPPPEGFDGEEEGEWNGVDHYSRTLSPAELTAVRSRDGDLRAREEAQRDRFFGFAGGRNSLPVEAETTETSEPSGTPDPSFGRRPEPETTEGQSMNTEVRESDRPCSWIPDQVREDGDPPPLRHPGESRDLGPESLGGSPRDPGFRRDDEPPTSKPRPSGILGEEPPGAFA
ncbi:MAG TPA: hypothetical protein VF619_12495 [Allosphingosinicella sp.]|jgi:hypothetical protein